MTSVYSSRLRLELPATGDQNNTWGNTENTNLGTLIDQAIAGIAAISMTSDANRTLTFNQGASDESRNSVLVVTSTLSLTATRTVFFPATADQASKTYIVYNNTTGGQSLLFKPTGGASGVTVANGTATTIYTDGNNTTQIGLSYNPTTGAVSLGTITSTLNVTGDFSVNTSKFTVASSSGNTAVAGTLGVTGIASFSNVGSAAAPGVKIGSEQSGFYYTTSGYLHVSVAGVYSASFRSNGDFTAVGNLYYTSDRRMKIDIRPLEEDTGRIVDLLSPYTFYMKRDLDTPHIGLIAQDAMEADTRLVHEAEDGTLTLDTGALLAVALGEIRQLRARVAALENAGG